MIHNFTFFFQEARVKLNKIMWPAILEKSKEVAMEYVKLGKKVVIMDAAVLLEAGWKKHCHEIWACIIPPEEVGFKLLLLFNYIN